MFTVYSKPNCAFCDRAKALLTLKGEAFEEKILDVGQPKEEGKTYVDVQWLKNAVPGAKSVPQIFKEDTLVGGYSDLERLLG